ncbi:MAG: DUF262 domain-containing protein [Actinomycetota bacterium]|nr:DUF262 domain-containing protein [Actinomycetota bacterium]
MTTQDLSWLLEQNRREQLDLDPPYQRRSVWTPRDRRSFMDTIFKNYPSPPIFLHKTIDLATGEATYHVVDGKQRISTVLQFLDNKVYLPHDFGDSRFAGKRWRDLSEDDEARVRLWNYRVTVEEIDDVSPTFVREVFERLNKNSRKLTAQELRHARFDGWLINFLEDEIIQPMWKRFKIHTTAKEKRMADVQNLAELAMVTVRHKVSGFDQEDLDGFFAELDEADDDETPFDVDNFTVDFFGFRDWLDDLDKETEVVSTIAQPFLHFYTLWSYINQLGNAPAGLTEFGDRYRKFMEAVGSYDASANEPSLPVDGAATEFERLVAQYKSASVGATTEEPQRIARLDALQQAMQLG